MFVLGAYSHAVTSRQVLELLRLHLGKEIPSNVPSSLRAYNAYVRPVDKGPPRTWSMTDKGLEQVRKISGLSLSTGPTASDFDYDIGIICALEHPELSAVMKAFGGASNWRDIGNTRLSHIYREVSVTTKSGTKLRVIATTSTSMGLTAAAIVTTQLINLFRPKLVAMIGIAAGTRSGGKEFGDVLVADPSVDYNSGKVILANGVREFQPDPYPIGLNPRLRSLLRKYSGTNTLLTNVCQKWTGSTPTKANRLHVGPVGAADQVIDDETRILEIQKNWRKLIGVEMETYGVYRAVHESPDPKPRAVSFKSVCDFAADKSDSWQEYAAFTAAEFSFEFLRTEWEALWPNR